MQMRLAGMLAVLAASVGSAANILTVSGSGLLAAAGVTTVNVEGWTLTTGYQNVSITAPLVDATLGGPIAGTEGTVYLVNQVGPGTTAANNVAPPVTITGLTFNFTTQTLWTGLTLPAGTYYVVWVPAHTNSPSMSPGIANNPTTSAGNGVSSLGITETQTAVASFPPATAGLQSAIYAGEGFVLSVTGDPAGTPPPPGPPATPAPSSLILVLIGLCGTGIAVGVTSRRRALR